MENPESLFLKENQRTGIQKPTEQKKNRTADISRYRIDQGTFTETIITRCMYYIRPVISFDILLILIEQMYGYKKGYSTIHHKTIFV